MTTFLSRVAGALLLKPSVFEDVERDRSATPQAMAVVVLSSVAAGVGAYGMTAFRPGVVIGLSVFAFALWTVWAIVTLQIGTRILPAPRTDADLGQLMRTIGFASAPGILRFLGSVPGVRGLVFAITTVWMLLAMVVAIRQALDYSSTARAFAVCAIGWALAVGFAIGVGLFYSPPLY